MPERQPRVFGYVRASTAKQADSTNTQKTIIAQYAASKGLPDPTWCSDEATSGKTRLADRKAGAAMLAAAQKGDHIILSKLDRGFRSLLDCLSVLDILDRRGIHLHIINMMGGVIDTSTPIGKLMISVVGGVAEFERALISERTKEGLRARKTKRVRETRHAGYGFTWAVRKGEDGKREKVRVACPEEREVMASIVRWHDDQGLPWDDITKHLASLKALTKDGKRWDTNRIRRAYRAELLLRIKEQGMHH